MSEGLFLFTLGTLRPADPAAQEICGRLKQGDVLRVKTAKARVIDTTADADLDDDIGF